MCIFNLLSNKDKKFIFIYTYLPIQNVTLLKTKEKGKPDKFRGLFFFNLGEAIYNNLPQVRNRLWYKIDFCGSVKDSNMMLVMNHLSSKMN